MASEITPTIVQKFDLPMTVSYGATERRISAVMLLGTKSAASDYFTVCDYINSADANNVVWIGSVNKSADNSMSADVVTYSDVDYKAVLTYGALGTSTAIVLYYTS